MNIEYFIIYQGKWDDVYKERDAEPWRYKERDAIAGSYLSITINLLLFLLLMSLRHYDNPPDYKERDAIAGNY